MNAFHDDRGLSLRLSVTDRCQLRCRYCMPSDGIQRSRPDAILSYEEIVRFVEWIQSDFSVKKLHITGGDPLVRKEVHRQGDRN